MKTKTEYTVINPDDPLFKLLMDVAKGDVGPREAHVEARALVDEAVAVWVVDEIVRETEARNE